MQKPKILEDIDNLKTVQENHAASLAENVQQINEIDTKNNVEISSRLKQKDLNMPIKIINKMLANTVENTVAVPIFENLSTTDPNYIFWNEKATSSFVVKPNLAYDYLFFRNLYVLEGVLHADISYVLKDKEYNMETTVALAWNATNTILTATITGNLITGNILIDATAVDDLFAGGHSITNQTIGSIYKLNSKGIGTISMRLETDAILDGEINFFPAYGQSWACGFEAPAISLTQKYDNLMFNGGIRTQCVSEDPTISMTSLISAIERTDDRTPAFPTPGSIIGETPCSGQGDMVKFLLASEDNVGVSDANYQILLSAPGEGSKSLEALSKGTLEYNRLIAQVQAGYTIAQSLGKTFIVQALSWSQGGSSNLSTYADVLEQLRKDIDTDVKAINGQKQDVQLFTWQQFGTGDGASNYNRYIEASEKYKNITCIGATYHLDQVRPDSLHLTSESDRWLGAYYGLAYKRVVVDKKEWIPLKPIKITLQGKIMLVKFNVPQPPLVFDVYRVGNIENFGFNLYNVNGSEKTINSVEIVSGDTIKIVANDIINLSDVLTYANKGYTWGRVNGQRGNLRDSQGDYLVEPELELPLHNWCVIFSKTINSLI